MSLSSVRVSDFLQYARYMYETQSTRLPASWVESSEASASDALNGPSGALPAAFVESKAVRTVYGLVPLKYALDWPIFASFDELQGCAAWMGGRIPTFEEARSIYAHVYTLKKKKEAERQLGKTVPAVNG